MSSLQQILPPHGFFEAIFDTCSNQGKCINVVLKTSCYIIWTILDFGFQEDCFQIKIQTMQSEVVDSPNDASSMHDKLL